MKNMLMTSIAMMAVVSLASCSANSDFDNTNTTDTKTQTSVETPINFGTYLAQSKTTRSGVESTTTTTSEPEKSTVAPEMTDDELKSMGFGVIAFYTETSKYEDVRASEVPNFMYNTKVSSSDSKTWTYSPIKYWPNGGQTATGNDDATPENETQYLSFFAYAPYKAVAASTGAVDDKATTGITALSSNATSGDPKVSYTLGATGADADLLWGTAGSNDVKTSGAPQEVTTFNDAKVPVNANLTKMKVGGKVQFNFKHALAKFGGTGATGTDNKTSGLMVVADIDNDPATTSGSLDANTKITVKSIKIESVIKDAKGNMTKEASIPTSGTLNLATGVWTTTGTNGKIDYEINSPKATATEGATKQNMNEAIAEPGTAESETSISWENLPKGVTASPQSVYTETTPLLIIPDDGEHTFRITIDYIVRTKDTNLKNGYTQVEQSFYKDLTLKNVSLNAKYNLLIHLGLTSVKFDATVTDWTNTVNGGTESGNTTDTDPMVIYMPANVASAK